MIAVGGKSGAHLLNSKSGYRASRLVPCRHIGDKLSKRFLIPDVPVGVCGNGWYNVSYLLSHCFTICAHVITMHTSEVQSIAPIEALDQSVHDVNHDVLYQGRIYLPSTRGFKPHRWTTSPFRARPLLLGFKRQRSKVCSSRGAAAARAWIIAWCKMKGIGESVCNIWMIWLMVKWFDFFCRHGYAFAHRRRAFWAIIWLLTDLCQYYCTNYCFPSK